MIAIVPRGGGLCAAGKSFEQFTQQKVENKMNQHNRAARLCRLFFSTLYISSFTFGGGFVIVTLMKKKFVDELHWITEEEMLDMTALERSFCFCASSSVLPGSSFRSFSTSFS